MRLSTIEYKRHKDTLMKRLHLSDAEYTELIKGTYEAGVHIVASADVGDAITSGKPVINLNNGLINDWDFVWYYKRNLHVVLPEPEGYLMQQDGVDCTSLKDIDKDIDIDTVIMQQRCYIRIIHRNFPVVFSNTICYLTIEIIYEDGSNVKFHCVPTDSVKKVFIESNTACEKCTRCKHVHEVKSGTECTLRPRFREGCVIDKSHGNPLGILGICTDVARVYNNRVKLSHARRQTDDTKALRSIMIARNDGDYDRETERLMPMYDYVKEYHESTPQEWKGGTHASPVSHPRSGYFRKCKRGTHILKNGEFVEVGKGLGKFVYVKPTIVNANKDSVLSEII